MTGELTLRGEVTPVSTVSIQFNFNTNYQSLQVMVVANCLIKQLLNDTAKII